MDESVSGRVGSAAVHLRISVAAVLFRTFLNVEMRFETAFGVTCAAVYVFGR